MFQPSLKLRPPIETFANAATLAALAEAAKTFIDSAVMDEESIRKSSRDDCSQVELERQADGKVAKALLLLNLHNALEALLPTGSAVITHPLAKGSLL